FLVNHLRRKGECPSEIFVTGGRTPACTDCTISQSRPIASSARVSQRVRTRGFRGRRVRRNLKRRKTGNTGTNPRTTASREGGTPADGESMLDALKNMTGGKGKIAQQQTEDLEMLLATAKEER